MTQLRTTQVFDTTAGKSLDQVLFGLIIQSQPNSLTLPDGTILKWGSIASLGAIGADATITGTVAFPVAFPTQCDAFFALVTPSTSSNFYGVTSLVSKSDSQAQFTVRNGATYQSVSSGVWFAVGK